MGLNNMFDELKNKPIEIFFDEWKHGKEFKLGIYDFLNTDELIVKDKSKYYRFLAILEEGNMFRVKHNKVVTLLISKACFDKEIVRHLNFGCLPEKIDLIMTICRKDKYHLVMKNVEFIEHKKVGDDILNYANRLEVNI